MTNHETHDAAILDIQQRHDAGYAAPLDGLSYEDAKIVSLILDELTKDRAVLLSIIERIRNAPRYEQEE